MLKSTHHQFYANRALQNTIKIAASLIKAGYTPVLVGHKGAVADALASLPSISMLASGKIFLIAVSTFAMSSVG